MERSGPPGHPGDTQSAATPPSGRDGRPPSGPDLRVRPRARPVWVLAAGLTAMAVIHALAFVLQVVAFWPAMVAVAVLSWLVAWHPYLPARLRPSRRLVAMGVVSGLALYAVSLIAALVLRFTPLWSEVQDVVALARGSVSWPVVTLLILLVTSPAEEVLWRGAVMAEATRRLGPGPKPLAVTTVLYALAVGLSANLVLPLAALLCGTVWGRQRQVTGSLVPGIVSHALWSTLMFTWLPGLPAAF